MKHAVSRKCLAVHPSKKDKLVSYSLTLQHLMVQIALRELHSYSQLYLSKSMSLSGILVTWQSWPDLRFFNSILVPPSTNHCCSILNQFYYLVTHSWANWIYFFIGSPFFQVMEECSGGEASKSGRLEWILEGFNATRQLEANAAWYGSLGKSLTKFSNIS